MAKKKSRKPNLSQAALERARQELRDGGAVAPDSPALEAQAVPARPVKKEIKPVERVGSIKRTMTRDELASEYGYVIRDLTSMGALAGILFVAMVVVALVIEQIV